MKKINLGQKDLIHFVGIGGIGMSGLAQVMKNMGFRIQGSDQSKNKNTISCSKSGIKIFVGHSSSNVKKANILVKSTAIKSNNHEIKYAKRRLAQLKTLLTLRLDAIEQKRSNTINVLIKKHNYMIGNFSE